MSRVLPRYGVYVPTKGRWQHSQALTIRMLKKDQVPFKAVIEQQDYDGYAALCGEENLLVLPFSNLGQGSIPARNWIKQHSIDAGEARHWQLDDNIRDVRRCYKGRRLPASAGIGLRVCEDFTDRYTNVAVSGLNYQMFVTDETRVPYYLNVHVYSCVTPATPILMADLSWRSAGDLKPGDEIVAYDEKPTSVKQTRYGPRPCRALRTATIERNEPALKPCYRVTTDIGVPVTASEEHPWLVWRPPSLVRNRDGKIAGDSRNTGHRFCWVETHDLRVGDQIAHLARPWSEDTSKDGGWISGMFDGEGSMVVRTRARTVSPEEQTRPLQEPPFSVGIGIAQKPGVVLDRVRTVLTDGGYDVNGGGVNTNGVGGTHLRGGFAEALRFVGQFQPTRLANRKRAMYEGRILWQGSTYELATVTAIDSVGTQQVASITTSTGTFITGGYLTHNCTLVANHLPYLWRGRYNEDTDMCLQVLADGYCTILMNAFVADKLPTMKMTGGNTAELYQGDGRLKMARSLERMWPGVVTVDRRFQRPQHIIKGAWKGFDTPLIRRTDVDWDSLPDVDEYGMRLIAADGAPKAESLQQLLLDADMGRQ